MKLLAVYMYVLSLSSTVWYDTRLHYVSNVPGVVTMQ